MYIEKISRNSISCYYCIPILETYSVKSQKNIHFASCIAFIYISFKYTSTHVSTALFILKLDRKNKVFLKSPLRYYVGSNEKKKMFCYPTCSPRLIHNNINQPRVSPLSHNLTKTDKSTIPKYHRL